VHSFSTAQPPDPGALHRKQGLSGHEVFCGDYWRYIDITSIVIYSISRTTLNKIEKDDPGVSLGNYANVLFVLGMAERFGDLADVKADTVGLGLEEERLPQRIRKSPRSVHEV